MKLHLIRFSPQGSDIFDGFLALRKRILVDGLGWGLKCRDGMETDQYDRHGAVYSIVTQQGQVVAGARAISCGASQDGWTYMLKDAHDNLIRSIPSGLLSGFPTTAETWECTRLVMDEGSLGARGRQLAMRLLVFGLCEQASGAGCQEMISLSPVSLGRRLERLGYSVAQEAPTYVCEDDRRAYRVFRMRCNPSVNREVGLRFLAPGGVRDLANLDFT